MNRQVTETVSCLRDLGFPLNNIGKALHKLTGVTQPAMARRLNVSRPCITTHIEGIRRNADIQTAIADIWGVTREELFEAPAERSDA